MFPPDRFEPTWIQPQPAADARKTTGAIPIGHPRAVVVASVWVSPSGRLAADWPGFPGTIGAHVELADRQDSLVIIATRDPALAALADPVPLRRAALERLNQRNMVEYGLAPESVADFVACPTHGRGLHALACRHVRSDAEPLQAIVLYDPDLAFPDLYCVDCYERFQRGDIAVAEPVCSYCQAGHLHRHRLVASAVYTA